MLYKYFWLKNNNIFSVLPCLFWCDLLAYHFETNSISFSDGTVLTVSLLLLEPRVWPFPEYNYFLFIHTLIIRKNNASFAVLLAYFYILVLNYLQAY